MAESGKASVQQARRVTADSYSVGGKRKSCVEKRRAQEAAPMGSFQRLCVRIGASPGPEHGCSTQFHIKRNNVDDVSKVGRCLRLGRVGFGTSFDPKGDPLVNGPILAYVSWSFRAGFLPVFVSMFFFFIAWVLVFAGLLMAAGMKDPKCLTVNGIRYFDRSNPDIFSDMFQLSWTTFSTVGYGHIFPSTSVLAPDQVKCSGVQALCTLESFVGVLYAGFCGAILFGKITRVQSNAQVRFSDPLIVSYGQGLNGAKSRAAESIPCPVLSLRVANELANSDGGGILDASISCVCVSSAESQEEGTVDSEDPNAVPAPSQSYHGNSEPLGRRHFSTVEFDPAHHPFFSRVWIARHTLDASSPVVKPAVKTMIRNNGGMWPEQLNSPEGIGDSLHFDQLIVSFSGVSNITAASVYGNKIYDFSDVNVGYQFAPMLYRSRQSREVSVDLAMVNDVIQQEGHGTTAQ